MASTFIDATKLNWILLKGMIQNIYTYAYYTLQYNNTKNTLTYIYEYIDSRKRYRQ